jgi:hypothetical protein
MRHLARLIATLGIAACSAAPAMRSGSQAAAVPAQAPAPAPPLQQPPMDSTAEYLLASAAADFHDHGPMPLRVRDVRMGHFTARGGEVHSVLCGQFLPAQGGGTGEWVQFATIRTSKYEQWIGAQGASFCQGPSAALDGTGDLSSALQSRLDAQR